MRSSIQCWALGFMLGVSLVGCSDNAWIGDVRSAQESAEQAAERGNYREAIQRLRPVAEGELSRPARVGDSRAIRQDAFYQLARWSLANEDATDALVFADAGLALGGDGVFRANLWVVGGQAHEALGRSTQAAADYHEALLINETLLDGVLGAED